MRLPTIPEMEDRAECFLFGHDWTETYRADGTPIHKCRICGEARRR